MDTFDAYIAGFFDGEGCCYISNYTQKGKQYSRVIAKLAQVNTEVLERIRTKFGGTIHSKSDRRAKENGWQDCSELVFSGLSARKLLIAIEPYLIVKKDNVTYILNQYGRDTVDRRKKHGSLV